MDELDEYCVDEDNVRYSPGDFMEVFFLPTPLHNIIHLTLEFRTANDIANVFWKREKHLFELYLTKVFRAMKSDNHSFLSDGVISDADLQIMAEYIWEHFPCLNECILSSLGQSNEYKYIKVYTDRGSDFSNCNYNFELTN